MKYYIITGDSKRKERISKRIEDAIYVDALFPESEEYKKMATCEVKRKGVFGCFRSHLKVMRMIVESDEEGAVVIEDDMMLINNFKEKVENLVQKYNYFNLILFSPYIGGEARMRENLFGENLYLIDEKVYSTGAYYIRSEYAKHVLSVYDRPFHLYPASVREKACDELFTTHSGGIYTYPPLAIEECCSSSIESDIMNVLKRCYWSKFEYSNYGSKEDIQNSLESCVNIIIQNRDYFNNDFKFVEIIIDDCMKINEFVLIAKIFNSANYNNKLKICNKVISYFNKGNYDQALEFFKDLQLINYDQLLDCYCLTLYYKKNEEIIHPLGLLLKTKPSDKRILDNIEFYKRKALTYIKEVVTVNVAGRLGNQLFEYANAYCLAKKYNKMLISQSDYMNYKMLEFIPYCPYVKVDQNIYLPLEYEETKLGDGNYKIYGYVQSEKYFKDYRDDIIKLFKPLKTWKRNIDKKHIAIHIRRGDYLQPQYTYVIPSITYYQKAMQTFKDCTFVIFSDDRQWCKEILKGDNIIYFEDKVSDEEELGIMSSMDSFILCNSTFGWWAAWLCTNKDKRVILPDRWFCDEKMNYEMRDIYCQGWETIDCGYKINITNVKEEDKEIIRNQTYTLYTINEENSNKLTIEFDRKIWTNTTLQEEVRKHMTGKPNKLK